MWNQDYNGGDDYEVDSEEKEDYDEDDDDDDDDLREEEKVEEINLGDNF